MFLKEIIFHEDVTFESTRVSQKEHFKVKKRTYLEENRRKPIYRENPGSMTSFRRQIGYEKEKVVEKTFIIFPEGLSIEFKMITIIVGDNGIGKTSLINNLVPPKIDQHFFSFSGESKEDYATRKYREWVLGKKRSLKFERTPQCIIVEKDIHKNSMINNLAKSKVTLSGHEMASLWDMQTASNGENNLDFLNSLTGIESSLIVLDEPETSLSIKSQRKMCKLIKALVKAGNQIIIVTHSEHFMRINDIVYDFEVKQYVGTEEYIKQQMK